MEGLFVTQGKDLMKLSEQTLVSCDRKNSGCNGGLEMTSFNGFYKKNGPILSVTIPISRAKKARL